MYIIKNAFRCISRAKGRNILIGIIVLVIAISACLGLSIRQAAESARRETMATLSVSATISYDRQSMMGNMTPPTQGGGFDKDQFSQMMGKADALTLDEYLTYAKSEYDTDFTYSLSASFNGNDALSPVTDSTEEDSSNGFGGMMGGMMGRPGGMSNRFGNFGDFSVVGYSSELAMTAFRDGTATITDGTVFEEGTQELTCIISEELALYNDLAVGDTITLTNPDNEEEGYTLTVVGLYSDSSANTNSFDRFTMTATDPANSIYMSYPALQSTLDASDGAQTEDTRAITGSLSGTYLFADTDSYYAFTEAVYEMGLDESYTVSSTDIEAFEASLTPLNTLSTMAGTFLIVILVIGAIILVVLNIFNVRERKYEIGVLTAMGMKKHKVAAQFLTEIFAVTMIAVLLGAGIGAVSSVPVTNALLANQVASQNDRADQIEQGFGRGEMPSDMGNMPGGGAMMPGGGNMPGGDGNMPFGDMSFGDLFGSENSYVTSISSAMNLTVLIQMLGIAVLLTLVSGSVSMLFVMRYEPLKILANRD